MVSDMAEEYRDLQNRATLSPTQSSEQAGLMEESRAVADWRGAGKEQKLVQQLVLEAPEVLSQPGSLWQGY